MKSSRLPFRSCLLSAVLAAGCLPAWAGGYRLTLAKDPHDVGVILQTTRGDVTTEPWEWPVQSEIELKPGTEYWLEFCETFELDEELNFREVVFTVSRPDLDQEWDFRYRQDFDAKAQAIFGIGSPGAHNRFREYLREQNIGLFFTGLTRFHELPGVLEPLNLPMATDGEEDTDVEMVPAGATPQSATPDSKATVPDGAPKGARKRLKF